MPTIVFDVSNDRDIDDKRWDVYSMSMKSARLVFKESDSGETVEVFYWDDELGFTPFDPGADNVL